MSCTQYQLLRLHAKYSVFKTIFKEIPNFALHTNNKAKLVHTIYSDVKNWVFTRTSSKYKVSRRHLMSLNYGRVLTIAHLYTKS